MNCLEFDDLQSLIYSDLAQSIADSKDDEASIESAVELVQSNVQTLPRELHFPEGTVALERSYYPASRVSCNIGFAQLAANLPAPYIETAFPALLHILNDIPYIDFEQTLVWHKWSLPDELVSSSVSAALRIASSFPQHRRAAVSGILELSSKLTNQLTSDLSVTVLTQCAPAFHGFYRAVVSSPFQWSAGEWASLTATLTSLLKPEIVERLNDLLPQSLKECENQQEQLRFVHVFLSRYVSQERPLTGYFVVCCVMEIIWTVLAQVLSPPSNVDAEGEQLEAAAANKVWDRLTNKAAEEPSTAEAPQGALAEVATYAVTCFSDLLAQIEDMDCEPSIDTYAWETMSESLKLATVCSVALREPDNDLLSRLRQLLSDDSPIMDHLVQEAALESTTVLVQNFPPLAIVMSGHLRRFVTSPLPMFEYEFASEASAPLPLAAAAKCLSLCIKLSPGDDFVMSNMYSLLNYIAATSKDSHEHSWASHASTSSSGQTDEHTLQTVKTGLQAFNEDQQRLIGISTISVVACLALEFKLDEVTRLTASMLLQRLRSAEPTVEAAIVYSLVDLAIIAPENTFTDIVKAFSSISRASNRDDPRFSNNSVLAAQTRLAQELRRKPEFRDIFLNELLIRFIDKGVSIQNAFISDHHIKLDDMIDELGSLLLPIDALLSQSDFDPTVGASSETVTLFRNVWFISVLFQLTNPGDGSQPVAEWQLASLTRIAAKTPALVLEDVPDFVSRNLEYNTVIRQEYAQKAIHTHKSMLEQVISNRHSEIRHLLPSQIIFLLAMYDLETMRSTIGLPSSLPTYFVNASLNAHVSLVPCMDSIVDKISDFAIGGLNKQIVEHSLPRRMSDELQSLLVLSCHRVSRTRTTAMMYLNKLIMSFPSFMCDGPFVFALLEVLSLLRKACEGEFVDEYDPKFHYRSEMVQIDLVLSDSYQTRNDILHDLHIHANTWLGLALARAPLEIQSTLQKYLTTVPSIPQSAELGASLALQVASSISPAERKIAPIDGKSSWRPDRSKVLATQIANKEKFSGECLGLRGNRNDSAFASAKEDLLKVMEDVRRNRISLTTSDTRELLFRCAARLLSRDKCDHDLLHYLVTLPFQVFSPSIISAGIDAWSWIIGERPDIELCLLTEVANSWNDTIKRGIGLFSDWLNYSDPFMHSIEYSPTDKTVIDLASSSARKTLSPHMLIMQMLLSRFQAARYCKPGLMQLILQLVLRTANTHHKMSTHPLAREGRFSFLLFGFEVLKSSKMDIFCENKMRRALYHVAFSWFCARPQWSYGANRVQVDADIKILSDFMTLLRTDSVRGSHEVSIASKPIRSGSEELVPINRLLRLFVENEILRLTVWDNPTNDLKRRSDPAGLLESAVAEGNWSDEVKRAWRIDPRLVVFMPERFKSVVLEMEVAKYTRAHTRNVLDVPEALHFITGDRLNSATLRDLKYVLLWNTVAPVIAVTYFEPRYHNDPLLLQYAHRVLEQHPVELTFFFVPQIVQALRNDALGYVKRFIFETARVSQLFCHQIIWNMKANCYKDDAAEREDPMKPELDKMTELVVESLSGEAREFYDREFGFFNEVTSISGKLKPFIKKSKAEKKAKIDEEMAKIEVAVGVYLPSNPDGSVVDIDRKSGRPLQSHAKAPFMATFKVRRQRLVVTNTIDDVVEDETLKEEYEEQDVWQAAIFKVGDDCRQDVLALQVIAMFKNVFLGVGLNLYLFPYRVTATAPGCGVIDVVPNATSRDEMGRAKINDLLGFFTTKYGGEDTIAFQRARLNFIQSMAAYSVACYILQIKDRHNGNIMIDGEGHIVHIGPGGIKFEPNSFKLNHEMVVLMGGRYSRGYALFQQLTVKAFLAIRPHAEQIISTVELMLGTELPSFKGEPTIKRLRDRFALGLSERQAADFMVGIVKNAHENMRSVAYDEFQRLQNGIPYK